MNKETNKQEFCTLDCMFAWMNEWLCVCFCVCVQVSGWMTDCLNCWCKWLNELSVGCINQLGVYLKANKSTVKTDSECNCECEWMSVCGILTTHIRTHAHIYIYCCFVLRWRWHVRFSYARTSHFPARIQLKPNSASDCCADRLEPKWLTMTNFLHMLAAKASHFLDQTKILKNNIDFM